jgi:hypothetical protein
MAVMRARSEAAPHNMWLLHGGARAARPRRARGEGKAAAAAPPAAAGTVDRGPPRAPRGRLADLATNAEPR